MHAIQTLKANLTIAFSTFCWTINIPDAEKVTAEIITVLHWLPLPTSESKIGNTDLYSAFPVIQECSWQIILLLAESKSLLSPQNFCKPSPRKGNQITGLQHLMTRKPRCFSCLKSFSPSEGIGCSNKLWTAKPVLFKTKGRKLFLKSRTIQTVGICKNLLLHTSKLLCFQTVFPHCSEFCVITS